MRIDTLQGTVDTLNATIESQKTTITEHLATIELNEDQIEMLNDTITKLNGVNSAQATEIVSLKSNVAAKQAMIDELSLIHISEPTRPY